jgi:hypothetical protein
MQELISPNWGTFPLTPNPAGVVSEMEAAEESATCTSSGEIDHHGSAQKFHNLWNGYFDHRRLQRAHS